MTIYRLAGAKTVLFWNEDEVLARTVRDGAISSAGYHGLQLSNITIAAPPTIDALEDVMEIIESVKADAVIGAVRGSSCRQVLESLQFVGYFPKAAFVTDCVSELQTSPVSVVRSVTSPVIGRSRTSTSSAYSSSSTSVAPSPFPVSAFMLDKTEFDPRMSGPTWNDQFWYPVVNDNGTTSAQLAFDHICATFGVSHPHWSVPMVMGAGRVFHRLLQHVGALDPNLLRSDLQVFNEPSFVGLLGFSAWGQNNVKEVILLQSDERGALQIVYPLGASTANFIYPAPDFPERVYSGQYMSRPVEIAMACIVAACIAISMLLFAFVGVYRNHTLLNAASPLFLMTILIGSILVYSTYYAWLIEANTAACYARFWLLGVGFVLMFGALFAKTWRVMRIFHVSELHPLKITNFQLLLILVVLVGIEIILLTAWSAAARPTQTIIVTDPLRASKDILSCSTTRADKIVLGILVAYKLAIVLYSIYLSIRVWSIPLKQYNESRGIAFAMYNMVCFGLPTFVLQISKSIPDPTMFVLRTLGILLPTLITIGAIFVPKLYGIATEGCSSSISTSASLQTQYNLHSVSTRVEKPPPMDWNNSPVQDKEMKKKKKKKKKKTMTTRFDLAGKESASQDELEEVAVDSANIEVLPEQVSPQTYQLLLQKHNKLLAQHAKLRKKYRLVCKSTDVGDHSPTLEANEAAQ